MPYNRRRRTSKGSAGLGLAFVQRRIDPHQILESDIVQS